MNIIVTPDDLIKRCLWSDYKRFVLKGKNEKEIIADNKPIVLSENDGYAIGLLKVIETDNLIHRFTVHMKDMINIKSTIFDKNVYMSVRIVEIELESFKKRFPEFWIKDSVSEEPITELIEHINNLQESIKNFEIHEFKIKDREVRYYSSKDVKKLIS